MVLASLKEAFSLITRHPVLWLPGILLALIGAADVNIEYYGGSFLTGKLWILEIIILPFFVAGLLAAIKNNDMTFRGFLTSGLKNYFRVLLPGIVIMFAALITAVLLIVPLSLIGTPGSAMGLYAGILMGIAVPFVFLMYFYDAVAVFESEKVFESIRRSIELTMNHTGLVVKFFLVNIAILLTGFFVIFMIWSMMFFDKLTPLTTMNATDIQAVTPVYFTSLLGADGIIISSIIFAIGALVLVTVLYTYKACFYKVLAGTTPPVAAVQGDYDAKGRWYKY
ncbi:MAG: hypothetical protein NTV68_13580 [Methanomicrobiales archaeon]|nr:hypothetical protein [Methanomicrobiales archaeon]